MPRIIAVVANKGGSGKTTSVVNLAAALARRRRRVLIVDADPQGDVGPFLGAGPDDGNGTLAGALEGASVTPIELHGLALVPPGQTLAAVERRLGATDPPDEDALRGAIAPLAKGYDYVLVDTPRGLGQLTVNAVKAASDLLLPAQTEFAAIRQLGELLGRLRRVGQSKRRVLGILPTMYAGQTRHAQEAHAQLVQDLGAQYRIFDPIPRTVKFADATIAGVPIMEYAPDAPAALAYQKLAKEVDA